MSTPPPQASQAWLIQSPPGLAQALKREMVYNGLIDRKQDLFVKHQRNHDLVFLNRLKDDSHARDLRIAEAVYRCPIYGRFKVSKRQLQVLKDELTALGPRRLVVSSAGNHFQRQDLGRWLTKELASLGYEFDPDLEEEVWLFCIDESYYFGIPQLKSKQVKYRESRESEREGSLPPPVASAMAFAATPRDQEVVLDPCCGSGTLLAEFHAYSPEAKLIGMDIDPKAVKVAEQNLKQTSAKLETHDSRATGLEAQSITLTLSNLPFGKQFGEKEKNLSLYTDLLKESVRIANPEKWRGVFLTSDIHAFNEAVKAVGGLKTESLFKVKIRGETASAYRVSFR